MKKSILIFAGAGASFGVDRELFPTTVQFRQNIPDELKNNQLLQHIEAHISHTKNISTIDIEHILWELGELISATEQTTDTKTFLGNALQTNQINNALNMVTHGSNIFDGLNRITTEAIQVRDSINTEVYKYYSKDASPQSLETTWAPLIRNCTANDNRLDIVTTNYDQVIEQALQATQSTTIHPGFTGGHKSTVNLAYWKNINPAIGLLTKLHGSVDWKSGDGGSPEAPIIRHGHPEFDGDHKKRLIIYPGFKGEPKHQPYKLFHDYFATRTSEATHILVIGFAFRDEYINQIFSLNIKPNTKIAVIGPTEIPQRLEFLAQADHIKSGFGQSIERGGKSINQFDYLQKWLE